MYIYILFIYIYIYYIYVYIYYIYIYIYIISGLGMTHTNQEKRRPGQEMKSLPCLEVKQRGKV